MEQAPVNFSNSLPTIPPLDPARVSLTEKEGLTVKQLEPLGVEVYGADVRSRLPEPVIEALEVGMANRGFTSAVALPNRPL